MGFDCSSDWSMSLRFPAGWLMSPALSHYSSDASPVSVAGASLPPLIGPDPVIPGPWLVEADPSPHLWCIEQKVWPTCSSRPLQHCSISCSWPGLGQSSGQIPGSGRYPHSVPHPDKLHTFGITHIKYCSDLKIASETVVEYCCKYCRRVKNYVYPPRNLSGHQELVQFLSIVFATIDWGETIPWSSLIAELCKVRMVLNLPDFYKTLNCRNGVHIASVHCRLQGEEPCAVSVLLLQGESMHITHIQFSLTSTIPPLIPPPQTSNIWLQLTFTSSNSLAKLSPSLTHKLPNHILTLSVRFKIE